MQAIVEPGNINGRVQAPASKSVTQRAYAAALLHTGSSLIRNAGESEDELAALHVIQQLGAKVHKRAHDETEIVSHGVQPIADEIDCGESGLCARLFTPIAAVSHLPIRISGQGSLLQRPMDSFGEIFEQLNVKSEDFNGKVPFSLKGPLVAKDIEIDGSASSQFLSGLLFTYAFTAHERVTIKVKELRSKPYVDLSLAILEQYGKKVSHENYKVFHVEPSVRINEQVVEIDVEGDWSSAAFWMVAGAINGNVEVTGLNIESAQADRAILNVLQDAGVSMSISYESIEVRRSRIKSFDFDATHAPDLFPILAILAAYAEGEESYITGLHRLWAKESNRAQSVADMLLSLGVDFSIEDDMLCVKGKKQVDGGIVESHNDHRIAMAAAIAAVNARQKVEINNAEAVKKSYPGFFRDLQAMHIQCSFKD